MPIVNLYITVTILVLTLLFAPSGAVSEPKASIPTFETKEPVSALEMPEMEPLEMAPFHFKPMGTYPNRFEHGQCTYGVASMKGNVTWSGNANRWDDEARARGLTVSDVPVVGAIAQSDRGSAGHVAVSVGLDPVNHPGQVLITEKNWDYRGGVRTTWQPIARYVYIYI